MDAPVPAGALAEQATHMAAWVLRGGSVGADNKRQVMQVMPQPSKALTMSFLASLSIGKRLYGVSIVLTVALSALAISSWVQLLQVRQLANLVGIDRALQLQLIASTELSVTQVRLALRLAIESKTPKEAEPILKGIEALRLKVKQNDDAYLKLVPTQEAREAFDRDWLQLQRAAWPIEEGYVALLREGKRDELSATLAQQKSSVFQPMQEWLSAERARQGKTLVVEVETIAAAADAVRLQLAGLVAAISIGLMVFSWYITVTLRSRVGLAQDVAERSRQGDFTVKVVDAAKDEFSPLLRSLDAMQTSLSAVVGTVRSNADGVATASAQIASGNNDLSQRTEQQASALEETAASMEELSSTVKQNADNAAHANRLAQSASEVAVKGGVVVAQVTETMTGINQSSKKIADIIGVIDGIAFQTNILALNAAVEAARAGEQGRGFAVVASEVRSLASRSADAAREIKSLIAVSVERVEVGTALVGQAGATMAEVVASIKRVTDIVGDISVASAEQSSGVSQVGEAVMQMDQVTQQNAALVEQSAAAAESLKTQAAHLVQAVSVFKLASF
jgi:methyl-accepting chemotaxis protein